MTGSPPRGRLRRALLLATLIVTGCDAARPSPVGTPTSAPMLEIPADWTRVVTDDGTMSLTLPQWLTVSDTQNMIAARSPAAIPPPIPNESDREFFWLLAIQPGTFPGGEPIMVLRPGQSLDEWLHERLGAEPNTTATTTAVTIPAGAAVRYDSLGDAGTPQARRLVAIAISRPAGVAYVQIMGPDAAWAARSAEIEAILQTFSVR